MNQMEIFKNPEFGSVRVIEENGKYLFCGVDVAKALGYTKPQNAIDRHCPHALKRGIGVQTGKKADGTPAVQMVEMLFIPEGDVYRLIVHSKLPSAERFERWVFDEVLPSIRKHGAYMTKEKLWEVATSPEALMSQRLSKEDYELVKELRAQTAIAQCEESESHFKYGFSAGLIVQHEAYEQVNGEK